MQDTRWLSLLLAVVGVSACQAPLKLDSFEAQSEQIVQRYDAFQDAAVTNGAVVVVGGDGVVLEKGAAKDDFKRLKLATSDGALPNFINVADCPSGKIIALSFNGGLWTRSVEGDWTEGSVDTSETVQDIACLKDDEILVSASFSSLLKSEDGGSHWTETTQDEDIMFTQLEFPAEGTGFAFGEFGAVVKTMDAGSTWERLPEIGPDFYPLASYFKTPQRGWVAGLGGAIYQTEDGGLTWNREPSDTLAPIYKLASVGDGLMAAGNYGTFLIRDFSGSWHTIKPATLGTSGYLRVVNALPNNPEKLLIAGQGYLKIIDQSDLYQHEDQ